MAAPIIFALQDGRLLFDAKSKNIFISDASGAILDAATGQPAAAAPAELEPVRINSLRRAIEAARHLTLGA